MKKRTIALLLAGVMAVSLCACGAQKKENAAAGQAVTEETEKPEETEKQEDVIKLQEPEQNAAKEESNGQDSEEPAAGSQPAVSLPPYEYPGPELFYTVLYQYLLDEFGPHYEPADVSIPCPIIVAEDESDHDDIRVWGDFWLYNYNLNGDVLETVSGGSYPGLIHIKSTDAGYEVTGMELVGDGSDYEPTAKKIFGKYYEDLIQSGEDQEDRDAIRAQIIANYAAANNLQISAFQDFGWDPVPLPEENIDTFYSIL